MEQSKQETGKRPKRTLEDLTYTVSDITCEFSNPEVVEIEIYLPEHTYVLGPKKNISKDYGSGVKINALLVYMERVNDPGVVLSSSTTHRETIDITSYDDNGNADNFDCNADFVLVLYHDISSTRNNGDVLSFKDRIKTIHDEIIANGPYNEDVLYKLNGDKYLDNDKRPKKAGMTIMTFKS